MKAEALITIKNGNLFADNENKNMYTAIDEVSKENNKIEQSLVKTKISDNSESENTNNTSNRIVPNTEKEQIKTTAFLDETKTSPTLNLQIIK